MADDLRFGINIFTVDEQTEKELAGLLERIIKRYTLLEEKTASCREDFKALNKDMRDAAIILRDKQSWRIEELNREISKFADKMESRQE
ncbi:MAG: hypothetical protein NTU61_03440 [Candidatus Altiarchaeota archaeon]|nr:hypothetical protein [Candidatus Altiarchaeota archaeon]